MKIPFEVLLLTSGVGAVQSAFFGIYLFSVHKKNPTNVLLGLLLLVFAVRIIKSVVYYFSLGHEVSTVVMNWGFGANLAIFPLLLLYLNSFFQKDYRINWLTSSFHFVPSLLVILLSPFLTAYFWMNQHAYAISLWSVALYLPFCVQVIYKNIRHVNTIQKVWIVSLVAGVIVVWAGYFANFIFGLVPYIVAPVLFSFLIYFLSYLGLSKNEIFTPREKYQNSSYSEEQVEKCFTELQLLLKSQQLYKDATTTLPKIATLLNVTPNLLSETINSRANQGFPDFINSYRINDAQLMLKDPAYSNQKITTIAYETGFNSISVFNAAFKKQVCMTPSAYRKSTS